MMLPFIRKLKKTSATPRTDAFTCAYIAGREDELARIASYIYVRAEMLDCQDLFDLTEAILAGDHRRNARA